MPHHDAHGTLEIRVVALLDHLVQIVPLLKRGLDGPVHGVVVAQVKMIAGDDRAARYGGGIFQAAHFFDDQLSLADHILEKCFSEEIGDLRLRFAGQLSDGIVHLTRFDGNRRIVLLDILVETPLSLVLFDAGKNPESVFSRHGTPLS